MAEPASSPGTAAKQRNSAEPGGAEPSEAAEIEEAATKDPWDIAVERENELQKQKNKIGLLINNQYLVGMKIGFGTYGSIYTAQNLETNSLAAVKFEYPLKKNNAERPAPESHLKNEVEIYKLLRNGPGIPAIHWSGSAFGYNIMVMDLLGPNLEQLLQFCDYQMSLHTVLMLARLMIDRIQFLHSKGILHRDIKPANFLIGLEGEKRNELYLLDYGLAKSFYKSDADGELKHLEYRSGRSLVGTARYASVNAHNGLELSRRDDLEALGYLLLSLRCGALPWQDLKTRQKHRRYKQMSQMKLNCRDTLLGARKGTGGEPVPSEFFTYLKYCQSLEFAQEPDYAYLKSLFTELLRNLQLEPDNLELLDWNVLLQRSKTRQPLSAQHQSSWNHLFTWAPNR